MDEGPDIGDKLTAEWQPRLEALRAQGYVVRVDTLIAPLVLEGSLPSGEPFEFRSEWKQAWLYVGLDPVLRRPRWVSWKDWENPKTGDQPQGALHEMEVLLSRWRGRLHFTLIGYWLGSGEKGWPDAREFVDETWDESERGMVTRWLEHGARARAYRGLSLCRFCGIRNGATELTDGSYIWPEGLAHYLRDHGVRLPRVFVDHIRARAAVENSGQSRVESEDAFEVDNAYWWGKHPDWTAADS
jgi:hypothetical protein